MKLYARRGFEWAEEHLAGLWCPVLTGATGSTLLDCNPSTSNHGALTNYSNLNTAWIGSQYGTVLDFDNTDDNVSISHLSALDSGDHTISFWYFTSTVSGLNQIIAQWNTFGASGPIIFRNGAAIAWQIVNRVTTSNILTANSWHFISCIRGSSLRVMCNGVLDSATTIPGTQNNNEPFLIGGPVVGAGTGAGNCRIAELQIHRRAITINEHQQAFQAGPGGAWQDRPRRSRVYLGSSGANRRRRILCGDYN